jgi:hypothetical protein
VKLGAALLASPLALTVPLPPASRPADENCALEDYMTLPTDAYVLLPLPLGATLTKLFAPDRTGALAGASLRLLALFALPSAVDTRN